MSKTSIEYGDRTWNVLTGCTVKSEGCKHCWARGMAKRLKAMGRSEYQNAVDEKGNWTGVITLVPGRLNEPFSWRKPQHVLVEYMGDLFHEKVQVSYVDKVFEVMRKTPQHLYQTLTKRPENMQVVLLDSEPLPNVILGVSIENQKRANERLPFMRALAERGWRTWVSYEPAMGPVDWKGWEFLNQLICGGESGPGARPMHPDWPRSARHFCHANEIAFFFKQWGNWMPIAELYADDGPDTAFGYMDHWLAQMEPNGAIPVMTAPLRQEGGWHEYQPCPGSWFMANVGKKAAGRLLDGKTWSEIPKGVQR